MIDAPATLRTYLLSQSTLTALTSTRIWAERVVPKPGYKPSDGGAIAFRGRGGSVDYPGGLIRNSWQMKCYGTDEANANAVYRALFDVLHDASGGGLRWAVMEVAGQTLLEDTGWPYVLTFYETFLNLD